jgi:hypothetical protein
MRRARIVALVLGAVGALAVLAGPAFGSSEPATGSFTETPETILSERQAGGNTIIHLTRDAFISGTYTGIGHADQWVVIHSDGSFNFRQTIAFDGVVCGQAVELEFRTEGSGDFNANVLTGKYTIVGPAEVGHGNGTITGEPGVGGTYEGQVHCD